ncbi:MAG: VWA domain-containing protein [Saccharofermentans sp.]|nr:VWA domain-containing protein [Saccharofermentans sp.]
MGRYIINPIIPIWIMAIICVVLLCFKRRGVMPYIRQILIVVLLFAINIRPMYLDKNTLVQRQKLDAYVIFCVDSTISMLAEDYDGNHTRLEGAKSDMYHIIDRLDGSQFALISFNNDARVLTPFTADVAYAKSIVDSIYPIPQVHATGTNISVAQEALSGVINEARTLGDGDIYLFFLTDGENTDNNRLESFSKYANDISGGIVMGYGTNNGGQMHYTNDTNGTVSVITDGANPALSYIDEDNLEQLASDLRVPYIHMVSVGEINNQLNLIREQINAEPEEEMKDSYTDMYYWFVLPLAVLIGYEFISIKRRA